MKIAIIGAMEQEVAQLREQLQSPQTFQHPSGCIIYSGKLAGAEIVLLQSGIGKVAAAMATTLLLEYYRPMLVINIGSAGSVANGLEFGDIVIATQVCYHDADVTTFGYPLGQLPNCPLAFNADCHLIELAQSCSAFLSIHAVTGLICSGDSFISGTERKTTLRRQFPETIAVDMEAASIAHICVCYQIPFVVVRAISDSADETAQINFDRFLVTAAQRSCHLVRAMVAELATTAPNPLATGSG